MRAQLSVLDGDAVPRSLDLAPDKPISIGRSRDNTVVLTREEQASRLHARVYFERGRWMLRDFGLNGTRVDEARVNQIAELTDGNEIRIGNVRFRFLLPEASASSSFGSSVSTMADNAAATKVLPAPSTGLRWTTEELLAMNQLMAAAVEARDPMELSRIIVQALYYQTGASCVGIFSVDPSCPAPKFVWPETAAIDDSVARQLTRRLHRDQALVWLAEDSAATVAGTSGRFQTACTDAMGLPLKAGTRVLAAIHMYKSGAYFSERHRKFAESVAGFASHLYRSLRARRSLTAELARLESVLPDGDELLGDSPIMRELRNELARVAASSRPVLIRGEAGVGKEQSARELHRLGPRTDAPFVTVRCTATPSALMEAEIFGYRRGAFSGADRDHFGHVALADEGTLYFDEVAELPLDCQVRLLNLIDHRTYRPLGATQDLRADVKLVLATHRDLPAEVKAGRFRGDLLAAIRGCEVRVPSLRERPEDIPLLAQYFLDRLNAECGHEKQLAPEALQLLSERNWPGNARQLRNVLAHALATAGSDTISAEDLGLRLPLSAAGTSSV